MLERYQRSKIITASNIIAVITLCVFILGKIFLSQSQQNESFPSTVDSAAFLGFGLAGALSMAMYAFRAWSLDLSSFIEWHTRQQIIPNDWQQGWYGSFSTWNIQSQYRLIGPIGFLGGLALASFGIFTIAGPFLMP